MSEPAVLVVDDEATMRELIRLYLEREGFVVTEAADGIQALSLIKERVFDLVILDLMLPELDGWEVCRRVRATGDLPILMLTARGEIHDRILGLNLGADDYLAKPFDGRELAARANAILRRNRPRREGDSETIHHGSLLLDPKRRVVQVNGEPVVLTPKEYELLYLLATHPGQVFARAQLLDTVWGYDFAGGTRTIDTHVKNLREKLGPAGAMIGTVWGVGYRCEVSP